MADSEDLAGNAILAGLPAREFSALRRHLEVVPVEIRDSVHERGQPIRHVYFPLDSVFSLVAVADDRVVVEVATIGREGMVGLPLFLGATTSPHPCFCQVAGSAARLEASDLSRVLADDGALHRALNRLTQATMVQIAQNVVCNSTHDTRQRAARWLLTTEDRLGREEYQLTQEFLAQMLGVRRQTVSDTARQLQADGLIRYRRAQVTIVDRPKLLATSCECYQVVKAEFDALTAKPLNRD